MTTALMTLNSGFPVKINGLESYLQTIQHIPMLSAEQELALATRYYEQNDLTAAKELVLAHLRFVAKVAKGYLGYGLPVADLIQEGNIGLMKAVQRFNPHIGVRLVTFALHWIKAEIHEYILRNWRIVKIATTKAQRKLFFNLRKLKNKANQLHWFTRQEIAEVAQELKVPEAEVERMEARLHSQDLSYDLPNDQSDEHYEFAPAQYLEDNSYSPHDTLENANTLAFTDASVTDALEKLDERSRHIITQRWLIESKATLQDLANCYGISAERVRQLEKNALDKLKIAILTNDAAAEEVIL